MPRIITPATPEHEISEHNARMFGSPKERLDFYRREIQYENFPGRASKIAAVFATHTVDLPGVLVAVG